MLLGARALLVVTIFAIRIKKLLDFDLSLAHFSKLYWYSIDA